MYWATSSTRCTFWEITNPDKGTKESENHRWGHRSFDDLIHKLNDHSVENKKAHFKAINQNLETRGRKLIDKINAL